MDRTDLEARNVVIGCEVDDLIEIWDGQKAGVEMFCLLVSLELDHAPQAKLISALSHALPLPCTVT